MGVNSLRMLLSKCLTKLRYTWKNEDIFCKLVKMGGHSMLVGVDVKAAWAKQKHFANQNHGHWKHILGLFFHTPHKVFWVGGGRVVYRKAVLRARHYHFWNRTLGLNLFLRYRFHSVSRCCSTTQTHNCRHMGYWWLTADFLSRNDSLPKRVTSP